MNKHQEASALKKTMQMQTKSHISSPPGVFSLYKYIPNILSALRVAGMPVCVWAIAQDKLFYAFWFFFAVCITDWLDGYLARRWQVISKLGQILDPVADKLLLIAMYLALGLWGYIPMWATMFVLTRDFLILAISLGILLTRTINLPLTPHFIGKLSTTLQMLFIGLVLASGHPVSSIPTSSIESILMVSFLYGMTLTTILSGFTYAWVTFRGLRTE